MRQRLLDKLFEWLLTFGRERTPHLPNEMTEIGRLPVIDSDNQADLSFFLWGNKVVISGYPWLWFKNRDTYVTEVSVDDFKTMMERFQKETRR